MGVYDKLLTVQTMLKAPKNQYNGFGKYKYRSCEDILEAVKPHLGKVKAVLLLDDTIELVGERYYVKATATFVDCEDPSQRVSVSASAREEDSKKGMDSSQVTGATSSYARKYALNGLLDIDDAKDSDATNTGGDKPQKSERPKKQNDPNAMSAEMATRLNNGVKVYADMIGSTVQQVMARVQSAIGKAPASMTDEDGEKVLALLQTWHDEFMRELGA